MTIRRLANSLCIEYFRTKFGSATIEIERKLLGVDVSELQKILSDAGCVEVFRGRLTSTRYVVDVGFLRDNLGIGEDTASRIIKSSQDNKGWSRLREWNGDVVAFYTLVTKLRLEGAELGTKAKKEYGSFTDDPAVYRSWLERHEKDSYSNTVEGRERVVYFHPELQGLEFSLDVLTSHSDFPSFPTIGPYVEIEGTSVETYLRGLELLRVSPQDPRLTKRSVYALVVDAIRGVGS